ncbi:hypothetical protein BCO_0900100 (plasmid) [Borrelia coriaceae ATCC 43381]|uniref:Uncharacterized protein n=1 Tax=Borrelia coriaceae ATCC 43381 TaxID=1408429 RepID=W5T2L2_9SPIR|nr:hypothetical protein BCO_0900100 [Borrelia coriaceae ATCC 43381]
MDSEKTPKQKQNKSKTKNKHIAIANFLSIDFITAKKLVNTIF